MGRSLPISSTNPPRGGAKCGMFGANAVVWCHQGWLPPPSRPPPPTHPPPLHPPTQDMCMTMSVLVPVWPRRGWHGTRTAGWSVRCLRVLLGWDPSPLGRDRTASSVAWPMSAPKATPRPNTATLALKASPLCEPFGLWPDSPRCPIPHLSVRIYRASHQGRVSGHGRQGQGTGVSAWVVGGDL